MSWNERSGRSTSVGILRKATHDDFLWHDKCWDEGPMGPMGPMGCTRRHFWQDFGSFQTSFGSSSHLSPSVWSLHVISCNDWSSNDGTIIGTTWGHSNLWNHWSCWYNNHWNHSASVSTSKSTSLWTMLGNLASPLLMHSKDNGRNRHGLGEATQVCVYVYVKSRVYVGLDII